MQSRDRIRKGMTGAIRRYRGYLAVFTLVSVLTTGWLYLRLQENYRHAKRLDKMYKSFKVVCYYTNWSQYRPKWAKFQPEDIDASLCSHVIFAFAAVKDSKLSFVEWNDESSLTSTGMYERVVRLKEKNKSLKVLLAVGGWTHGSKPFSKMVATKTSRNIFIRHVITVLRDYGFDGLDLDWEYPCARGSPESDKENFSQLVEELYLRFMEESLDHNRDNLLLTAAVPGSKEFVDNGYDVPRISQFLDLIHIMAYDMYDPNRNATQIHNALRPSTGSDKANQEWALNYWLEKGADKEKITLGIPFYGRSFTLKNEHDVNVESHASIGGFPGEYTREKGVLAYYEIRERLNKGWARKWDDKRSCPYAFYGTQWVSYEDESSIRDKVKFAKDKKVGGVMVWSLDLDDFTGQFGEKYPLLKTIQQTVMKTEET